MNLRSRDDYARRAWDWGFLNDCFRPSKIRVSDLDGIVERNGRFLYIEAKPAHVNPPRGQEIMFDAMVGRGDYVLVLYGEPNEPVAYQQWPDPPVAGGEADIQGWVSGWFRWADGHRHTYNKTEAA